MTPRPRWNPAERPVVVFNPAGGGAHKLDDVRKTFGERGVAACWIETTTDDPGTGIAREAAAGGAPLVVAAGGDGTVRAVAEGLLGTSVPLGVIPTGTGNLLARGLGIPLDPSAAVEVLVQGAPRSIDVGFANGRPFVVMAGLGVDARMVAGAGSELKSRLGFFAYLVALVRELRRDPFSVEVRVDGHRLSDHRASLVLVGNLGELPGGVDAFPDADPADGRLEILMVRAFGMLGWLAAIGESIRRNPHRRVHRHTAGWLSVRTSEPVPYEVDGEECPPVRQLEFTVSPKALTCIVPPREAGGS